jgi:hypothetical protein
MCELAVRIRFRQDLSSFHDASMNSPPQSSIAERQEMARQCIRRYLDEFYDTGTIRDSWVDVENACDVVGQFECMGQWVPRWVADLDKTEFEPNLLKKDLPAERIKELDEGAEPTDREIARWRERVLEAEFAEGIHWLMVYVNRINDGDGREMWGATLHGDHGILQDTYGPYRSEAELTAALEATGAYRAEK